MYNEEKMPLSVFPRKNRLHPQEISGTFPHTAEFSAAAPWQSPEAAARHPPLLYKSALPVSFQSIFVFSDTLPVSQYTDNCAPTGHFFHHLP